MMSARAPTLSALAAVFLLFAGVLHTAAETASIRWHKTLQQATAVALKTNKPIMIEFWADWCEPCQVMEKDVYSDPNIAGLIEAAVVPLRLSFDNDKQLVRRYEVEAVPYLIFGDSYGTELLHHRGILATKDLSAIIRALPSDISEINRLDGVLQKDNRSFDALKDFGARLRETNLFQVSNQFYERALKTDGAKKNPVAREEILREIGSNFLELHDGKEAASAFQRCVKEFPNGESRTSCQAGLVEAYGLLGRKIEQ